MADILTQIGLYATQLLDIILRNMLAFIIVAGVLFIIYMKWIKPKPIDEMKRRFQREWEATTGTLGLKSPKKLGLCTYPISIEELRDMPIHRIHYEPQGMIRGINVVPQITKLQTLLTLKEDFSRDNYHKLIEENKKFIDDDRWWIVLAYERKLSGGIPLLFPKIKRSLIYLKENQILDTHSRDDVIRVRGVGIECIGDYEMVNDEFGNVNRKQLQGDIVSRVDADISLMSWSRMGEVTGQAMNLDAEHRKIVGLEGARAVLNRGKKEEAPSDT